MAGSSEIFSEQHRAALAWAARGFHVFPLVPGTKVPLPDTRGLHDATTDPARITEWWREHPEANIGCAPAASGCVVLDIDTKGTKRGDETLAALELTYGDVPPTLTVLTPSGGKHLWFTGDAGSSVQKLGSGLDTRGRGGYVLLPPSPLAEYGDQPYTLHHDAPPALLPEWVVPLLTAKRDKEAAVTTDLDLPANIDRATRHLRGLVRAADVAVEGEGGNDRTYRLFADLHDMGLSEARAVALVLEHWNDACIPPWEPDELEGICANAYEYAQNDPGSKAVTDPAKTFSAIKRPRVEVRSEYYPRDEHEQDTRPEPEWSVPGWIQKQSTIMLYGPPGSYKSFAAVDIGLSFAAGLPLFGLDYTQEAGDVIYAAGEGILGIEKLRRPAWRSARMITRPLPFYTVGTLPLIRDASSVEDFLRAIEDRELKPSLVVLDTMSRLMAGLNENDTKDVSLALEAIDALVRALGCSVLVLHHTGKDGELERGSSAFRAGFDTMIRASASDNMLLTLTCNKQKDGDEPKPVKLRGRKVLNSLAFYPVSGADAEEDAPEPTTKSDFQRSEIGAVLRAGGHFGLAHSVTTQVLAHDLLLYRDTLPDDPEEAETVVRHTVSALNRLAKGTLAGYVVSEPGVPLRWALPT